MTTKKQILRQSICILNMNRYTSKHLENGIIHNNTNTLYESYNQPNC